MEKMNILDHFFEQLELHSINKIDKMFDFICLRINELEHSEIKHFEFNKLIVQSIVSYLEITDSSITMNELHMVKYKVNKKFNRNII